MPEITASVLPTGASTEATLSTINGKIPAIGQQVAGASMSVVLTAAQITTLTPLASVAVSSSALPTGASTEATLSTINGKIPTIGQQVAGASMPVVLTAAQITTLTPLASVAISNTVDSYLQTSKALIAGSTPVFVSGVNISNGSTEDIWGSSVAAWITPTAATTVNITSSSASDAAAGVGAQTISITGLNGSYAEVSETITMNGVANVATSNSYFIIHKMIVLTAGSSATAVGTIISTWTGGGTPVGPNIVIGSNESQAAIYQVPAGYSLYVTDFTVGSNAGGQAIHSLMAKPFGGVYNLKQSLPTNVNSNNAFKTFNPPMKFIEKTTIKLQSKVDAGEENYGSFDGVLVAS